MATQARPSSKASGSAILDSAPPSPPDRIFSRQPPVPPGSATRSLLGDEGTASPQSNAALAQPANRLLLYQSMLMQSINGFESIVPGYVPDPIKQWAAAGMEQIPQMVQQMSQGGNPAALSQAAQQGAPPAAASVPAPGAAPVPGGALAGTPTGPAMGLPAFGSPGAGQVMGRRPLPGPGPGPSQGGQFPPQ